MLRKVKKELFFFFFWQANLLEVITIGLSYGEIRSFLAHLVVLRG